MISKVKTANHEEWLAVPGFEGLYEVSNTGKVKSLEREDVVATHDRQPFKRKRSEKLLKQYIDRYGYLKVYLYKNKKPHYLTVHRLVALAFIPNTENKNTVDHIDCDRTNNRVENLRWVTVKENLEHSHRLGRQIINATPIVAISPEGETIHFGSQREASKVSGVGQYAISRALHGENPNLKGWVFSFD